MSFLSKVCCVTGSANGLRRNIAEVRFLNLMAIVMTFSILVIYNSRPTLHCCLSRIT
jgi:hypothetical protein